ncbi:MAG: MarR family winged helix-turn-helix transcriptional regulator [Lapillicoccus sp.]
MARRTLQPVVRGETLPRRPETRGASDVSLLLQRLASEGDRLSIAVATRQRLNHTDMSALMHIMEADLAGQPLTPTRLQRALGLSSGATTAVIDRLEAVGHSRRERDTTDRRRVILRYGEAAQEVGRSYFGPLAHEVDGLLRGLTEPEVATVRAFLTDLVDVYAGHAARVARGELDPSGPKDPSNRTG